MSATKNMLIILRLSPKFDDYFDKNYLKLGSKDD